ncbi:MAG TPA: hypothetical protein VE986_08740, partial [Hyphomicrobiales bacterium]|nr:hypothetical protein [Hyphomicrobiales bacterium]
MGAGHDTVLGQAKLAGGALSRYRSLMLKTAAASLSPSRRVSALDSFSGALAFLALYAAIWTIFAVLSGMALHRDMTEAYSWGREFQLG